MPLKADVSQLNLPHETKTNLKVGKENMDMLRSIGKQSGELVESVLKEKQEKEKKRKKATERRICGKGRF